MPLGSAFNIPGAGDSEVKSDINVTPLVDVCLVMLIIFMVVTPLLTQGADLTLPQTSQPPKMPEGAKQKTISMTARAEVVVDSVWIPDQQLVGYFKTLHEQSPEKTLVIKADKSLKYKEVRKIMEIVNDAGFGGVGLVTDKRETAAAGS
ncbi:MAG: biopolymer transporter ExbD [Thermoanaerobaculia bacterium]